VARFEARAENWRRHVQQLTATGNTTPAARQRVDSAEVKAVRNLVVQVVLRLSEILTPEKSKHVTVSSDAFMKRYPLATRRPFRRRSTMIRS
jgi:hypothetical protein